ncbi:YkvI family membrane protein [Halorussus sp. AFM4]|uniref:YkvI family membrane protein n=1 Tax=Halorussus sp. AFM4 TaxID=3421651 RepID=UPI003EBA195C
MSNATTDGDETLFERLARGPFGKIVLPAIILQSVLIGGGYATGREIVAYGAKYGAAGWLAVVGIWLGFTVMAVLTFELARTFEVYDYKNFIKQLIGRLWPAFDLLFLVMAVLVIAIMASAAGNIMEQTVGIPYFVGVGAVIAVVGVLSYAGETLIERFKTGGTAFLYVAYLVFGVLVLSQTWGDVTAVFASGNTSYVDSAGVGAVVKSGILYVGYNLVVFPAVFFALERQQNRRESVVSGVLAGTLMTLPFALTYVAFMGFYPAESVMGASVPWLPVLESVGGPAIIAFYGLVMGWTLIETSVGLIHALIDRLDENIDDVAVGPLEGQTGLSSLQSGLLAVGVLVGALLLSRVGIIALVAQGYTMMAYLFIALFAVPLLTVGVLRIRNPDWGEDFFGTDETVAGGIRPDD